MTYSQTATTRTKNHSVRLEYREKAYITGVDDVDSFNEGEIHMITSAGRFSLTGTDLHITNLNLDEGQVIVEGMIATTSYEDFDEERKGSLFSNIFK